MDDNSIETQQVMKSQTNQLQELGVSFDDVGRLDEDVVCRSCEYNLRSLTLQDNCPECDTPIKLSLQTSLLRFSNLAWIKRVRSGITFMIVYVSIWILFYVCSYINYFLGGAAFQRTSGVRILFSIVILVLQVIAVLRITKLEPGVKQANSKVSARKLARICLLIAAGIGAISGSSLWLIYYLSYVMLLAHLSLWVGLFSKLVLFIGMFAIFFYGRSIAPRFPSEKLAKATILVMWGSIVPLMAQYLLSYTAQITSYYGIFNIYSNELSTSFTIIQYVVSIPSYIFGIWGLVLLFKYRSHFTKAMKLAA